MEKYIKFRLVVSDLVWLAIIYLVYTIITKPELLANWIKVIRSGFGG